MRPIWRSTLAAATVAVLAATTAPRSLANDAEGPGDRPPIVGGHPAKGGGSVTVTLVTGDRVQVLDAGGSPTVSMLPRPDGTQPLVETRRVGDDVYVYPEDAAAALAGDKIDEELFNVTGLVRQGYDDAHTDTLPLIARYDGPLDGAATVAPRGAEAGVVLESIDSVALSTDKAKAATFWADLTNPRSRSTTAIDKVWLDSKVYAELDRSTKQVHAPEAWEAGFDGAGTTVAVLDTGADADHPDLAGRITAGKDFTDSSTGSWHDGHGHGTHVSSTVGGSGTASGGVKKGVAPHTDLLIGKVLGDDGGGSTSGIVAGMEWAVAQDADVVSMSLGSTGAVGDCDDPMATAVNALSNTSDSLFVVAAGNNGPANNTVSSPGCAASALTVGAVDRDDSTAPFSSRGPTAGLHTLKPEITAPGVGISAAATEGRGIDAYRSMSGTSMATPHVAGAAAVVKQAHPGWTGEQIKADLVASADADIPGDVRETGGGRLDVAAALDQEVTGSPGIQAGSFNWPQVREDSVTVEVPYTNEGDHRVKLRLRVAGTTGNDGSTVKGDVATLRTSSVTIAPGATVRVPLRINPSARLKAAQYGDVTGRVLATGDDTVTTPFSLFIQPETVHLRIKLIDRNGQPASGASSVDLVNTDTAVGSRWANNGDAEQVADVRPGSYFLTSYVVTPDADGTTKLADSVSYFARPELTLTKDTTLVLDARKAHRITVQTDRRSQNRTTTLAFSRSWDDVWQHSGSLIAGPTVNATYADVQGAARDGDFEFGHYWRRYAPLVEKLSLVGGGATLHPTPATYSSRNLDGTGELPVVDAGTGTSDEVAAAGVAGKIALVKVPDTTVSVASGIFAARQAGAAAVLVYHAASGRWQPSAGMLGTTVPVYAIPADEAAALRDRLAQGSASLTWKGTASSPYVYNLGFTEDRTFTRAREFVVRDKALGRTESTYRAMGAATDYLEMVSVMDAPGGGLSVSQFEPVHVPGKRTELFTTGASWQRGILGSFPYGEVMVGAAHTYEPGSFRTEQWYDGTVAPAAAKDVNGELQLAAERQGNLIGFASGLWGDSHGHWSPGGSFGDSGNLSLRRNGELVDELAYTYGVFDVPAEDSAYEMELRHDRYGPAATFWKRSSSVTTTWKFRSRLDETVHSQGLPIMFPRLDLPEDGLKTLPAADDQAITVRVTGHAGYTPGAITSAKLEYSSDGATWTTADVTAADGKVTALVDHAGASGQPVTLRVEVTDSKGNAVTQTITRAYDVR